MDCPILYPHKADFLHYTEFSGRCLDAGFLKLEISAAFRRRLLRDRALLSNRCGAYNAAKGGKAHEMAQRKHFRVHESAAHGSRRAFSRAGSEAPAAVRAERTRKAAAQAAGRALFGAVSRLHGLNPACRRGPFLFYLRAFRGRGICGRGHDFGDRFRQCGHRAPAGEPRAESARCAAEDGTAAGARRARRADGDRAGKRPCARRHRRAGSRRPRPGRRAAFGEHGPAGPGERLDRGEPARFQGCRRAVCGKCAARGPEEPLLRLHNAFGGPRPRSGGRHRHAHAGRPNRTHAACPAGAAHAAAAETRRHGPRARHRRAGAVCVHFPVGAVGGRKAARNVFDGGVFGGCGHPRRPADGRDRCACGRHAPHGEPPRDRAPYDGGGDLGQRECNLFG